MHRNFIELHTIWKRRCLRWKWLLWGAGISGLSCALTLEKFGITPTIFEKRNSVGDRFVNAEAMFSILNRPSKD